jgi:hypothetical protein
VRRIGWLFGLVPILGSTLHADWKIVTRTGDRSVTEYFKGSLMRTESSTEYTEVLDFEHRSQVNWRNDLRQYVVIEWPLVEPQNQSTPGPVIVIERKTTDTGERKQFFGRTARRLISHVTRSDGPETTIDGWYIEAPGLPKWKRGGGGTIAILTMAIAGQRTGPPRIEVKQTGPTPEGFLVRQRAVYSTAMPGGAQHTSETVSEVTELVEGPLADKLFQPPEGYRRVGSLPGMFPRATPRTWSELIQAHWRMVEDWFSSAFRGREK